MCHPDKSSHPDAPRAFEALKQAKRCLSEPLDRDDYLLNFIRQQKVRWENNWTSSKCQMNPSADGVDARGSAAADADSVAEAMRERESAPRRGTQARPTAAAAQRRHDGLLVVRDREEEEDEDEDEDDSNEPQFHMDMGKLAQFGEPLVVSEVGSQAPKVFVRCV